MLNAYEKITVRFEKAEQLEAPVEKGQQVGSLHYMVGEEEWRNMKLVTTEEIEKIDWKWSIRQVMNYWLL